MNIELSEREDLGILVRLQVSHFEKLFATHIDYIASLVNQIALRVDSATKVIDEMTVCVLLNQNVISLVSFENSNRVFDIKALPTVSKQLWQLRIISKLLLIKPLTAPFVNQVPHRA